MHSETDLESFLKTEGMEGKTCKLGLFGGTFDPPHRGHMTCLWEVGLAMGLDAMLLLPAGAPVFKKNQKVTKASLRAKMCKRALEDEPNERLLLSATLRNVGLEDEARRFERRLACALATDEIKRAGDTYTVDTLEALKARLPQTVELYFVVGADAFASFDSWYRFQDILRLAHLVVPTRPGWDASRVLDVCATTPGAKGVTLVPVEPLAVSSRMVRARVANGRSVEGLVPEAVFPMMQTHGLYACASCGEKGIKERTVDGASVFPSDRNPEKLDSADAENDAVGFDHADAQGVSLQGDGCEAAAYDEAFFADCLQCLEKRLKPRRFAHSVGVAACAEELACMYGIDVRKARAAGLLHDWDKAYDNESIKEHARSVGVEEDDALIEAIPQVLHGRTAALTLRGFFPQLEDDVLQAIDRHTVGACDMSPLDMVIYCADALEPQRSFEGVDDLRRAIGRVSLEQLFFLVLTCMRNFLAQDTRALHHPRTEEVFSFMKERMVPARSDERDSGA